MQLGSNSACTATKGLSVSAFPEMTTVQSVYQSQEEGRNCVPLFCKTKAKYIHLTLIHGYKKTYKFTGGGVRTDPKNKAVLFKRYEKQEITLGCAIKRFRVVND